VLDTLLTSTSSLFEAATIPSFFDIDTPTAYPYYKFSILSSEGTTGIGVQYMQVYAVDTLLISTIEIVNNCQYQQCWLIDWQTDWLTDWLTEWLTDWLTDWLIDWLIDWLTDWLAGWLAGWLADW